MRKLILRSVVCALPLALLFVAGCDKEEKDDPLDSVFQTQWQGTYTELEYVRDMTIGFDSETTGYIIIEGKRQVFTYKHDGNVIDIKSTGYLPLGGAWWIYKFTNSHLIMINDPYSPQGESILDLNRIY